MPVIAAQLLGPPLVTIDGQPPPPPMRWRKHLGLAILLWTEGRDGVSRARATDLLWGDRSEGEARHSLNEALRVLRRAAGADALASAGDLLTWRGPVARDTDAFEQRRTEDPRRAAELIRGAWCDGFAVPDAGEFDRWLDDHRRIWHHRLLTTLCQAAREEADRGNLHAAHERAAQARRFDPLSELAAQTLAEVLAWTGDRVAAHRELDAHDARLRAELGIEPGEGVRRLRQRLSATRGTRRGASPAEGAQLPLVGREDPLRTLLTASRQSAARGQPALLLIEGPAGAGRTRVLEELVVRLDVEGWTVATVRALPADAADPEAGLRAVAAAGLWAAPGVAGAAPAAIGSLAATVPVWGEHFAANRGDDRWPLADALGAVLRSTASEQPILLALDDAEWLDTATLEALPRVMRACEGLPVVVAATLRQGHPDPRLDQLRGYLDRPGRGACAPLPPLQAADLAGAVRAAMPEWPPDAVDRLTRRLHGESLGIPAVAMGVLAAVQRGMSLDESAPWPPATRTFDSTLPGSLPDALVAATRLRVSLMPPLAREVLAYLALRATPMTPAQLRHCLDQAEVPVDLLDHLEWEGWVVSDGRGYRLRTPALGGIIAGDLLTPGQRRRMTGRFAGM